MIRRTLETLAAGCAVYVLMAACSGSGRTQKPDPVAMAGMTSDGGQEGQGGAGGDTSQPGAAGELASAGAAGILDPVAGASAQTGGASGSCECPEPYVPPEPVVVEAECDITVEGTGATYAEAEFPGKTAEDLAAAVAIVTYPATVSESYPASVPPGHHRQLAKPFVLDGKAAVYCGSQATAFLAVSVTFILP